MASNPKTILSKLIGSSSPDIPSGYALTQLAQSTHTSPADCKLIYDTLIAKLTSSADVSTKFKCIRTIKYCVVNGSPDFKHHCQRNNAPIRECSTYRVPSTDALTGNAANNRLNTEANECVKVIFDDTVNNSSNVNRNKLEGMSSNGPVYGDDDNTGNSDRPMFNSKFSSNRRRYNDDDDDTDKPHMPSKYGGYGSTAPTNTKRNSSTYGAAASMLTSKLSETANTIASVAMEKVRGNQYASDIVDRVSTRIQQYSPHKLSSASRRGDDSESGYDRMGSGSRQGAGRQFSGFNDNSNMATQRSNGQYEVPQHSTSAASSPTPSSSTNYNDGDYTVEHKLVDSITAQSGIKAVPSNTELSQFVQSAQQLSMDAVLDRLISVRLHSTQPAPVKLKALAVLSYMVALNDGTGEQAAECVREHLNMVEQLSNSSNAQLKSRADALLQAVGAAGADNSHSAASTHHQPAASSSVDILNFADNDASAQPTAQPKQTDQFDLFNLPDHDTAAPQASQPIKPSASFDFMSDLHTASPPPQAAPSNNSVDSMFGEMSLKSTSPVANTTTPQAAVKPTPSSNTLDLLDFGAAAQTNTTSSNNGDRSLMDTLSSTAVSGDSVANLLASQQQKQQRAHFFPQSAQTQQPAAPVDPFAMNGAQVKRQTSASEFAFLGQPQPGRPTRQTSNGSTASRPTQSDSFSFVSDLLKQ